jgi:[CysO sulfur-carrier protein]-S-L-cysteine hydrolase
VEISRQLLDELVAHVLEDRANEICGVVAVEGDRPAGSRRAVAVHRAANMYRSPLRFEIEPMELFRLNTEIEDAGLELGGIYHSHVRSEPYPSQTDINYAAGWPGVEWIIVGLATREPLVRSFLIEDGAVRDVELEVA